MSVSGVQDVAVSKACAGQAPSFPASPGVPAVPLKCPNGHALKGYNAPIPDYACDACGRTGLPKGARLWNCDPCDYDVCDKCHEAWVVSTRPEPAVQNGHCKVSSLSSLSTVSASGLTGQTSAGGSLKNQVMAAVTKANAFGALMNAAKNTSKGAKSSLGALPAGKAGVVPAAAAAAAAVGAASAGSPQSPLMWVCPNDGCGKTYAKRSGKLQSAHLETCEFGGKSGACSVSPSSFVKENTAPNTLGAQRVVKRAKAGSFGHEQDHGSNGKKMIAARNPGLAFVGGG